MTLKRLMALAWDALLLELALYRCLARWILRRPDVPGDATAIGYAQLVTPMLWLWTFGSATEVIVVEIVLRSIDTGWGHAIRLPLLVIGIWGVLWMLGMMAAYRVRPHLLSTDRLRVRNSARTWVDVPLEIVASAHSTEHDVPGVVKSLHVEEGLLLVGVSSRTNLELRLAEPTTLATSKGPAQTITRVALWVDDPREAVRRLQPVLATVRNRLES